MGNDYMNIPYVTFVLYYQSELEDKPVMILETCELNLSIRILEKSTGCFVSFNNKYIAPTPMVDDPVTYDPDCLRSVILENDGEHTFILPSLISLLML